MTVKEAAEKYFGNNIKDGLIGIYEKDDDGNPKPIYPDYADEVVELYGDNDIVDYFFATDKNVLVVEMLYKTCKTS